MIFETVLEKIIDQQRFRLENKDFGYSRENFPSIQNLSSHALIISGIRRCGKSTLMMQLLNELRKDTVLFLNFETPQLFEFAISDFARLDNIIEKKGAKILMLDELQVVDGWELYVRQKIDEGFKVIITGSNASLSSKELGTKLTGRHITKELYPFSYSEFIGYKNYSSTSESLDEYLNFGGFPEYLKSSDPDQLSTLFEDILMRDIVARHGIKDIKSLQKLALFLISNIGSRVSANKLKQTLQIGATSTILTWFSYLEYSYLFGFLPQFSYSIKSQIINQRKVYSIDPGLISVISTNFTENKGRKLENLVYLHLKRKYKELYYFDDNGECDFIASANGEIKEIIQVCYDLNPDNYTREIDGLKSAMKFFKKQKGKIVTYASSDQIKDEMYEIEVIPAYKFLLNRNY